MFGLENKKKPPTFHFDLEDELADAKEKKKMLQNLEKKTQAIKTALRHGEDKDDFDLLGQLLNGYTALSKVVSRIGKKK
ncbi:MAG: sctE [Chlamydiales bacterium]|jgi:hypothetical protein|nr:sctE [Chlamydiales bacterium]